jgi:hypothetical protein
MKASLTLDLVLGLLTSGDGGGGGTSSDSSSVISAVGGSFSGVGVGWMMTTFLLFLFLPAKRNTQYTSLPRRISRNIRRYRDVYSSGIFSTNLSVLREFFEESWKNHTQAAFTLLQDPFKIAFHSKMSARKNRQTTFSFMCVIMQGPVTRHLKMEKTTAKYWEIFFLQDLSTLNYKFQ